MTKKIENRTPEFNAAVTGSKVRRDGIWNALKANQRPKVKEVHKRADLYIVKLANKQEVKLVRKGNKFQPASKHNNKAA